MKKIRAIFKGKNGSLGYITGHRYTLILSQYVNSPLIRVHDYEDGSKPCEYNNTILFLENWDSIDILD